MLQFFLERRPHAGMTFAEYLDLLRSGAEASVNEHDEAARERAALLQLNLQRMTRILKTSVVGEPLRTLVKQISVPQIWMVLTEPWCGDSAQCTPHVAKLAELNSRITLRFLLRDQNTDIMDLYLTNGTRGIPKLVAFDEEGDEVFRWGPRPCAGQELFLKGRSEGLNKKENLARLHLWYASNRGEAIEEEFTELLKAQIPAL